MNEVGLDSKEPTTDTIQGDRARFKPLRIWPVVVLIVLMLVLLGARHLFRVLEDEYLPLLVVAMLGPAAMGVLVLAWWLFFSRATMPERIVGFFGAILVAGLSIALSDVSMLGAGSILVTIPMGMMGFATGALLFGRMLSFKRTTIALLIATCGFGFTTLMRSDGMWGNGELDWHWRWEQSAEDDLLAKREASPKADPAALEVDQIDSWLANSEWPQFRGPESTGHQQTGLEIDLDWENHPPELIWKVPVGPGWSSFVVAGKLLFTQEQLGEAEAVICYQADTGEEVWSQRIESRFFEALGGAGPRATPTLAQGGLFVQGASGQVQRLDPKTGDVVWAVDLREVAKRQPPTWGFSSSPLVMGSVVIVHAGGAGDLGTLAFDIESGELKWSAVAGDHTYSSAQRANLAGKDYVLMLTNTGLNVLDPATGESQLDYTWKYGGYRVLQPAVVDGDSVLLPTGPGGGTRRIRLKRTDKGFDAEELWTSRVLNPDFNDLVIYKNHAYGFDGSIFTCVNLADGKRMWKRGRYGKGQVLLLEDSGLLLVASEKGKVVLVSAEPSIHQELVSFQALEGRTWNHPVVVGDRLYLRNSREAACYRLPVLEVPAAQ